MRRVRREGSMPLPRKKTIMAWNSDALVAVDKGVIAGKTERIGCSECGQIVCS